MNNNYESNEFLSEEELQAETASEYIEEAAQEPAETEQQELSEESEEAMAEPEAAEETVEPEEEMTELADELSELVEEPAASEEPTVQAAEQPQAPAIAPYSAPLARLECEDDDEDEQPKKPFYRNSKFIVSAVAVLLAVALIASLFANCANKSDERRLSAYKVGRGDVSITVVGSGNIQYDSETDVKVSSAVTIKEKLVEAGDYVQAGEVLATVDGASVSKRIDEVQAEIADLDKQINSADTGTKNQSVKAGVTGRVKEIYATEGESVSDIMVEHSALMIISTDGKMVVTAATEKTLAKGDKVTVVLADGSEEKGVVESCANGECVVTISDEKGEVGEKVTVKSESGDKIGAGELAVHMPYPVVAASGTVNKISVKVGDKVTAAKVVMKLSDVSADSVYQTLIADREAYVEELNSLIDISRSNAIVAPCSGVIQSVGGASSSSSMFGDVSSDYSSYMGFMMSGSSAETPEPAAESTATVITVMDMAVLAALTPAVGSAPITEIKDTEEYAGVFVGEITWEPADAAFAAGSAYTAKVKLTADAGYKFDEADSYAAAIPMMFPTATISELAVSTDGSTLTMNVAFSELSSQTGGTTQPSMPDFDMDDMLGAFDIGGFSGLGGYDFGSYGAASSTSTDNLMTTAFTMYGDDAMAMNISIDELDILSVKVGQEAEITLDAIEGETFTGRITRVSQAANEATGQYDAVITIDKDERMLSGMSATAVITVKEVTDAIMIPVAALNENGGRVYVHTTYEDNVAGGEVEVETGMSDGVYVEIVSGLEEGQTIYYNQTLSAFEMMMQMQEEMLSEME